MKTRMSENEISKLKSEYLRISENIDFEKTLSTTLFIVGIGASSPMVESLARMGVKSFILFDPDIVEKKNLVCQNFRHSDIGRPKSEALKERLEACEFEEGNNAVPALKVMTKSNFLEIHDDEFDAIIEAEKQSGSRPILIMATDYHPVQARGNRIAIKHNMTTFWVGIYKRGMAAEIIFYKPDHKGLPCYRCIAQTRYDFFYNKHLQFHLSGDYSKTGVSSGLPLAATFIDSILGHLIIGAIHSDIDKNPHGKLFNRLIVEKRNLIQCQLDPDYRLNGSEDLFEQLSGPDVVTFNTLFQKETLNPDCPDCQLKTASVSGRSTDYTKDYMLDSDGVLFRRSSF